jgi:hypothetical protein
LFFKFFADQRFGLFLVGLDEMKRFGEGADDFGDEGAMFLDGLLARFAGWPRLITLKC